SRATSVRYFPGLGALLCEAAGEGLIPEPGDLLGVGAPDDTFELLTLVDDTFARACREREAALGLMLARTLERSVGRGADGPPLRQNRRGPLIEQALAPLAPRLGKARAERLVQALTVVVGTEGFLALTDVAGLDRDRAR